MGHSGPITIVIGRVGGPIVGAGYESALTQTCNLCRSVIHSFLDMSRIDP